MRACETFFRELGILAVTFDDVASQDLDATLRTGYSEVMPDQVSVRSLFTRNAPLGIPIASAAMDRVTDHKLAIALAMWGGGGIGVIHRNFSIEAQVREVARVKYQIHGGPIKNPRCVHQDQTLEAILKWREEKGFPFHSFPVIDENGVFVGLLTHEHFKFSVDLTLHARDVMTKREEARTGNHNDTPQDAFNLMKTLRKGVLPILDPEGRVMELYVFNNLKDKRLGKFKDYNTDGQGRLRVAAAVGVGEAELRRVDALVEAATDVIVVDTAHADSKPVIEMLRAIKRAYPHTDVMVGNVSEEDSTKRLCDEGADGVKVNQGTGGICTTRVVAGIGTAALTAINDCAMAAEPYGAPICADGGIRYSGDIAKAIGAGAHSVMIGGIFAGTDEAPGEKVFMEKEGRYYKEYRGMGSIGAMRENEGSRARYRQGSQNLVPEGVEGFIPYRGSLADVLIQYVGGLRIAMGYVGAATIEELRQKANFRLLTSAGRKESHPHDVVIIKEAPNYFPEEQVSGEER